jgi:hypothetical protein
MRALSTCSIAVLICLASGAALPVFGQDGLRPPLRAEPGLDPSFAPGWLNPEGDAARFTGYHWRDAIGFAPLTRLQWSYGLGKRSSLGMSLSTGRDFDAAPVYGVETRRYGIVGSYSLAEDWSLSAEGIFRDPNGLLRPQDLRIGLRRRF